MKPLEVVEDNRIFFLCQQVGPQLMKVLGQFEKMNIMIRGSLFLEELGM